MLFILNQQVNIRKFVALYGFVISRREYIYRQPKYWVQFTKDGITRVESFDEDDLDNTVTNTVEI
jgi:hypothetical protein